MKYPNFSLFFKLFSGVVIFLFGVYYLIMAAIEIDPTHVINSIFAFMLAYILYLRFKIQLMEIDMDELSEALDKFLQMHHKQMEDSKPKMRIHEDL